MFDEKLLSLIEKLTDEECDKLRDGLTEKYPEILEQTVHQIPA